MPIPHEFDPRLEILLRRYRRKGVGHESEADRARRHAGGDRAGAGARANADSRLLAVTDPGAVDGQAAPGPLEGATT